jgi:hypothetical protein
VGITAGALIMVLTACVSQERREPAKAPERPADAVKAADSVKIVSASPGTDSPLRKGQKVVFRVEVDYVLNSAGSGTLGMVVQREEGEKRVLATEMRPIPKGEGRQILTKEIEVPDTRSILVFTPLIPDGVSTTNVVDRRSYSVAKR